MGELWAAFSDGGVERRSGFGLGWRCCSPPDLSLLSEECLSVAEESAQQVLNCIHPTLDSDEKRRDIIDYLQRLIKCYLNCEVFSYGSVPLKTYLPDGDIDLTVIKGPNTTDESLANDVLALLQREQNYGNAEFQVKDTQYIDAEVKLVKCLVRDIVIDISFNQLGGLSTLCFLEQVDRLIGRNHLFKRSIILVKAWCYYESRILGAHHGLISTYALETLILYIFHLFHSSLCSPLAVLYRFLTYYSQFDWDNFCISLKGPVCKSSLPDIVVKMPESGSTDLMLSDEFLENCMEMFSVSSRLLEGKPKTFQTKHLNIIDPLKENNNLGRSVHIGNFYRVRSAFKYGARKLGQVLSQPTDKVADKIREFFANTIARHGNENRSSVQHLATGFNDEESLTASLSSPVELFSEDGMLLKSPISCVYNGSGELEFDNDRELSSEMGFEGFYSEEGVVSGHHMTVDTDYLATSNSSMRNGTSDCASSSNYSTSLSPNNCHKPFSFSSKLSAEIGISEAGSLLRSYLVDTASPKYGFNSCLEESEESREVNADNISLDFRDVELTSVGGESEAFNALADLSGDYDSHIRSLLYGQLCHGFSLSGAHHLHSVPSRTERKKPWDIVRKSMPFWQSQFSRMSFHPKKKPMDKSTCFAADFASPTNALQSEGTPRTRGIGTYFPNVGGVYRERPSQGWSRNKLSDNHDQFHRDVRSNGSYPSSPKDNLDNGLHEVRSTKSKSHGRGRLETQCQSPRVVGNVNQTDGDLRGFCSDQFHRDVRSNGSYLSSPKDNLENGLHEVPSTKSKSHGRGRLETQCQSPRVVGNVNQTDGDLRGLCSDQFHRDVPSNGSYPSSPKHNRENGLHEVRSAKSKSHGRGRWEMKCQSPRGVGDVNQTDGDLRELCRIEFGSIGNLAEAFSASGDVSDSPRCASPGRQHTTAVKKQERVAGQSIHLKNEVEFPPLSQQMH